MALPDIESRRYFDEFEKVRVSRFRASGVIDPARREAVIPFPDGKERLINVAHTRLKDGGGWSYFLCPRCQRLAQQLHLIDGAPLCFKCCEKLNIRRRSQYGRGQAARIAEREKWIDATLAKLHSTEPLRLKPAFPSHYGRAQLMHRTRSLTREVRRMMIQLRIRQIAEQAFSKPIPNGGLVPTWTNPTDEAARLIDWKAIWRAKTQEKLEAALDKAQDAILAALKADDPQIRLIAAKLMLRTRQARQLGFQLR